MAGFLFTFSIYPQADSNNIPIINPDTSFMEFIPPVSNGPETQEGMEEQEVSSLLTASRDIYMQFASFQFGAARFKIRGTQVKNQLVMINGVNMANPETGQSTWSTWGGLNDVTRLVENKWGNSPCAFGFSGSLGYIHIDSKASSLRKGTKISVGRSNRQFKNRWIITHSTGNLPNGWAITLSASNRSGQLYSAGTYIRAYSFFIALDKRLNDKQQISFSGFAAPTERAGSGSETKEVFDLAGTNYYNGLWGYQNGKIRNTSVRKVMKPVLLLSHNYILNRGSWINTSMAYTFGKTTSSGLNWNQAPNPRPDYYRYLPSYYYEIGDSLTGNSIKENWLNDVNTRQINWDKLIAMNQANLHTVPSINTSQINTNETRARYILENRIERSGNLVINTNYFYHLKRAIFSGGISGTLYQNRKFKEVEDLLGSTYWLDYDQFAQNLGVDPFLQQNNIEAPDKKIYKGNEFGYNYTIHIRKAETWSQLEYNFRQFDLYGGISLSESRIWREGLMANGKFPTTSKGTSRKLFFTNYGVKAGGTYKLSGRQFLLIDGSYLTRPPDVANLFIAPDVRNDVINNIHNEKVLSIETSFIHKAPGVKLRLTAYYSSTNDQTLSKTFWSDEANNFINYILTGLNQQQQGIELGFEKTVSIFHTLQWAVGFGEYRYTNRPVSQAWQSNTTAPVYRERVVYIRNYHPGGTPQLAAGFGYRYNSARRLFAGFNLNYFDKIYVELNPDKRTTESVGNYYTKEIEPVQKIIRQEQLPSYYTINLIFGKTFSWIKKSQLNIHLSINNLLNIKNAVVTGTEQLRWDPQYPGRFANKYAYLPGTTYSTNLSFTF